MNSVAKSKRRIAVGGQQESVGIDSQCPSKYSNDEIEQRSRITTKKENRKPGYYSYYNCSHVQEGKNNIVWNDHDPFY